MTNRFIQAFALLASTVIASNAQVLVPRIGITRSSTTMDSIHSFTFPTTKKQQTGIVVGIGYEFRASKNVSFLSELSYIRKGETLTSTDSLDNEPGKYYVNRQKLTFRYAELQFLSKYNVGKGAIRVSMYAGPSLAIGLKGKCKYSYDFYSPTGTDFSFSENIPIKFNGDRPNEIYTYSLDKGIDISIQVGGSITVVKRLTFDVRYGVGLTTFTLYTSATDQFEFQNRVLTMSVSTPLNLKKS